MLFYGSTHCGLDVTHASRNSAMVSLNMFWMSSMLQMFVTCNSSQIFFRRAIYSGQMITSCTVLLFYTVNANEKMNHALMNF